MRMKNVGDCPEKLTCITHSWSTYDKNVITESFCIDSKKTKTINKRTKYLTNHQSVELTNEPKSGYKIKEFKYRHYGTLYKCTSPEGYNFDLQANVVLDIITNVGINSGVINCPLIWVRTGSVTKLIRYQSELYKNIIDYMTSPKVTPIAIKDLKEGVIYQNKTGKCYAYLGIGSIDGVKQKLWAYPSVLDLTHGTIRYFIHPGEKKMYYVSDDTRTITIDDILSLCNTHGLSSSGLSK